MTKEELEAERTRLIQTREQAIANANACGGAIAFIETLLAKENDKRIVVADRIPASI